MEGKDALGSLGALPRRLNGRPAACDPCRARKVACDHGRPVCNRCRKRNTGSQCVYSEARTSPQSFQGPLRPGRTAPVRAREGSAASPGGQRSSPRHHQPSRGYIGTASYNAVFEEAKNNLPPSIDAGLDQVGGGSIARPRENGTSFGDLPSPVQEMSLFVLRCLRTAQLRFTDDGDSQKECGWADIAVDRIVKSLRQLLPRPHEQGDEELGAMAEMICRNTARRLRDDHQTARELLDEICDENLRWEALGLLWACLERISDPVHALRAPHLGRSDGTRSIETSLACLSYCVHLSRYFTEGNFLLVELYCRKSALESIVDGEACGAAITMATFLGLHAQPSQEGFVPYTPTFSSEYKRRVFGQTFISDKSGVVITSRPPLLNRRYCTTPLPLDISDEDLASDQETFMKAVQSVDARGWNTVGGLYPVSVIRARIMIAFIRDELVEIALSHSTNVRVDDLLNIKTRQMDIYAGFPRPLIYDIQDLNRQDVNISMVFIKLLLQLEHLQNIFFAERLLISHGYPDEGDLLITTFQMLSLAVLFWTNRERFPDDSVRQQFEWVFLAYGAPAAGVLCLELLRPTFSGVHQKDSKVSRSSIIQQMSLLVGYLEWIRPSAPNSELCADCKAVIQRVLDHCLNFGPETSEFAFSEFDWGFANQPGFSFELLDTFDWLRTDDQQI